MCLSSSLYVEELTFNVVVLGSRAFWELLNLDDMSNEVPVIGLEYL